MSVRRSLNQYSRPGWWKNSADFSDLNDLDMRERKPLYPFGSNSLKTRVRAALPDSKNKEKPGSQSVPCVTEDTHLCEAPQQLPSQSLKKGSVKRAQARSQCLMPKVNRWN